MCSRPGNGFADNRIMICLDAKEESFMTDKKLVVIDAPSNLGLRPPEDGAVPGCYKMPWALRDRGLIGRLGAADGGSIVPPRYMADWKAGDGDRNADSIREYSIRLANRIEAYLSSKSLPIAIGGDCSILIGNTLALRRRGMYGLVFIDAHSDFRHPGNSPAISAAAGEDLAIVTGRGDGRLINIEKLGPYVCEKNVCVLGILSDDEALEELNTLGIHVITNVDVKKGKASTIDILKIVFDETDGFWIHLDFDVIDKSEMAAVDCPEDTGITFSDLSAIVRPLVTDNKCAGMEITIYDPDLDPQGIQADRIVEFLVQALRIGP